MSFTSNVADATGPGRPPGMNIFAFTVVLAPIAIGLEYAGESAVGSLPSSV